MNTCPSLAFSILLLIFSCGQPKDKAPDELRLKQFGQRLDSLRQQRGIPGLSVAVAYGDSVVYAAGFGYADIEDGIPAMANTPYWIASITKPVAATAIMQLVEEGKVDLDWKMKDFHPDWEGTCARILAYFREAEPEYAFLLDNYHPERDDITLLHHLTHTAEGLPGERYKYNGFLYGRVSRAVEEGTGLPFDSLVNARIIRPLGMAHSAHSLSDSSRMEVIQALAKPYKLDEKGNPVRTDYPDPKLNAGAGMVASATDILLFDRAYFGGELVDDTTRTGMLRPTTLNDGSSSPYGIGWFVQLHAGDTLLWHYGHQPDGYSGIYLRIPQRKLSVVMLANSDALTAREDLGKGDITVSPFVQALLESTRRR
ncbi:serine hydrolase domain-containing protein [Olivibacter sitiensis]|uniref:serine hydrolase domain-containing protein n=1 Tax=Olivibacter sitiensis TaxID=376470 RepID=UPI000485C8E1|nr:serine hydrolase domain-containing protein [Olivibacter sitiensis]